LQRRRRRRRSSAARDQRFWSHPHPSVGTIIDAEAFRYQPWPQGLVQDAYFSRRRRAAIPQSLIGTVVRNEISAGQPLSQGDRSSRRARLPRRGARPGHARRHRRRLRDSGVAGFVFPGDRVDLVLTQEVDGGGDGPPLRASETIVRNIRVLAVDQRLNCARRGGQPGRPDRRPRHLRGDAKIAEKIAVAQTIGQLSLSLRSLADNNAELERAIAAGEVQVRGSDPRAERQMLLQSRAADRHQPTYTVGAESPASSAAPCPAGAEAAICRRPARRLRRPADADRSGRPHRAGQ
jgi:pilus assembly protein CpaB